MLTQHLDVGRRGAIINNNIIETENTTACALYILMQVNVYHHCYEQSHIVTMQEQSEPNYSLFLQLEQTVYMLCQNTMFVECIEISIINHMHVHAVCTVFGGDID